MVLAHLISVPIIGRYAVMSFFVLSGFLMTTIMHQTYGYTWRGRSTYAFNRMLRLYPNFWFAIFISLLLIAIFGGSVVQDYKPEMHLPRTLCQWFENFSMLYLDWVPLFVTPRLAPPTWALTTEILF